MSDYTVVGQKVARVDAVEKVTGAAQYGADVHAARYALRPDRSQ